MLTIAYSSALSHPTHGTPFEVTGPHLSILRVLSLKTCKQRASGEWTINDDTDLD